MGFTKKKYKKDESIKIVVSNALNKERLEAQEPVMILDAKTGEKLAVCHLSVSFKLYSVRQKPRLIGIVNDIPQVYSLIFKNKHVLRKDQKLKKRREQLRQLSASLKQTIKKPFTFNR